MRPRGSGGARGGCAGWAAGFPSRRSASGLWARGEGVPLPRGAAPSGVWCFVSLGRACAARPSGPPTRTSNDFLYVGGTAPPTPPLVAPSERWYPADDKREGLRRAAAGCALAGSGMRHARAGCAAALVGPRAAARRCAGIAGCALDGLAPPADPHGGVGAQPPHKESPRAGGWATSGAARSSGMGVWGALRGILASRSKQPPAGDARCALEGWSSGVTPTLSRKGRGGRRGLGGCAGAASDPHGGVGAGGQMLAPQCWVSSITSLSQGISSWGMSSSSNSAPSGL